MFSEKIVASFVEVGTVVNQLFGGHFSLCPSPEASALGRDLVLYNSAFGWQTVVSWFDVFSWTEIVSGFVVLFALIDVLGSVPIFLGMMQKNRQIKPLKSVVYSFLMMAAFLFIGHVILQFFNVDVSSFAIAGALVIFIISVEMLLGVELFQNDSPKSGSTLVPIVFPLLAGPGTFTALLSMRANFHVVNILVALFLNMVFVYVVMSNLRLAERMVGAEGVYLMRKFFGIILMAISVKLFVENLDKIL